MALDRLPNELLLIIINYLDMYSLTELKCVCKRFYLLINSCNVLTKRSNHLLVTNQMSEEFRKRCTPLLSSYSSKFITHYNWINGIYKERKIYESKEIYDIALQLTQNSLLFFADNSLYSFNRSKDGTVNEIKSIEMRTFERFSSIVCCNDVLISGHRNGSIRFWRRMESKNENDFKLLKVHSNVYNCAILRLAATSECIAASRAYGIKILKYTYEENILGEEHKIFHEENRYIRSIKFDPTGTKVAWVHDDDKYNADSCLSYCLSIYDINNQNCQNKFFELKQNFLMDLLWEDPHTILTLDLKHIIKMDMRTSKFVRIWDAFDDVKHFSCFSSDNLYTIITGTGNNKVLLWDQRKNAPVQVYVVNKNINTQTLQNDISSLSFDSRHLYLALHIWGDSAHSSRNIYEYDFKENNFDREKMKAVYSTNFGGSKFEIR